jgi:hypothetical protein
MGYSQSSLAVLHKSPDAVLAILALRPTGEREKSPESPFVSASLPRGWFLVVADGAEHDILDENTLRQLSTACEVVTCTVEEHVMVSEATGWRDGQRLWRVTHDAQTSIEHLQTEGELPSGFIAIRDRLAAEQRTAGGTDSDTDYIFDIPVELAMSFTGYRHDATTQSLAMDAFEVLESVQPPSTKKSFFGRLFSK